MPKSNLEPTPKFDCHVHKNASKVTSLLSYRAFELTQVSCIGYFYYYIINQHLPELLLHVIAGLSGIVFFPHVICSNTFMSLRLRSWGHDPDTSVPMLWCPFSTKARSQPQLLAGTGPLLCCINTQESVGLQFPGHFSFTRIRYYELFNVKIVI